MPWTRTRVYPHPFGVPETPLGSAYNYISHVMMEQVFWKGTQSQVNSWRKKTLGLPAINVSSLAEADVPFLYSFSPSVVPPPYDWPDWIHTCGYWFLDSPEGNKWQPPEGLVEFIQQGPVFYIGFGSIVVPDPDEMTRTIVEAVQQAGVRAILSKGWSGRLATKEQEVIEYPPCIYPLERVPHDWLFSKMAGVVHHGGAGTTAAGLRAGIPTLIRPFFGDQFFWADRVQDLGVGICLKTFTVCVQILIHLGQKIGERVNIATKS